MKKLIATAFVAVGIVAVAAPANASIWADHGVSSGRDWGAAVSGAAPGGALGCHASGGAAATCP
jgi:hypothetical protein